MEASKVKELIIAGLTDPHVEVADTTGTGDHFSAVIISDDFNDLSLIKQHQLVYKSLGNYLTNEIHALQLKTYSKSAWEKQNRRHNMEMKEQIIDDINNNNVILYMKGTKDMPMCGFSNSVVQILNHYGVEFKDVNVLTDPMIREKLSEHSGWPTIPQLFVNSELIGGADIAMELHNNGELLDMLDKATKD